MTRCSLSKEAYSQSSSPLSTIVCASRRCHQGRDTARRALALIPYCLTTFHDFYSTVSRQSDCKSMGSQLMSWTQRVNHSTHLGIRRAYTLTHSDPPFYMQLSQLCTYVIKSAVLVAQSTVKCSTCTYLMISLRFTAVPYGIAVHGIMLSHIVVKAHCYALQCRRIDCEEIRS